MYNFKFKIYIFLLFVTIFSISFFANPKNAFAECSVQSATFNPSGVQDSHWYLDANKPDVIVNITTNGCAGKTIEVSITEEDVGGGDDELKDSGLNNRSIIVPESNQITMHLKAGEEVCEAGPGDDCNYYITVYGLDTSQYESNGYFNGNLRYECNGTCLDEWIVESINLPSTPSTPTPVVKTDTTYTPLAPLPGLGTFDTDPGCTTDANGVKTCTNPCVFGKYMNIMIKLLIGIAAVLAVLMIVIGGLEYMTSELISSKEHGKERISNAILGLVIALSSWALLNTLNPKLLDVCLDKLPEAKITIMDEGPESPEDAAQDDASAPTGPAPLCPEGIQKTNSGMYACGSIAQKLDAMINAAKNAGLKITGGGYRTVEAQRALRIKNCGGNETDRNATCRPPTAIPGASRHNNGLAFDLKCEGSLIRSNENACFKWLKTNATTFGLSNLKSEQWHWSIDGK